MVNKKWICIILPRGESFRNFIYSDFILNLRRHFQIILISVIPSSDFIDIIKINSDKFIQLNETKENYLLRFIREITDLSHNRYLWSQAAKTRWKMRDVESNTLNRKLKREIKKFIATVLSNNFLLSKLDYLYEKLFYKSKNIVEFDKLFKEIKPDLVFNTSHSHSVIAEKVIMAAQKNKIKTSTFLFSWDNLTSQGRMFPQYDYYFAWNSKIKKDLLKIYPKAVSENVFVTGTPQFSFHFIDKFIIERKKFLKKLGLMENDKYILYSAGMSHHVPHEPYVIERISNIIKSIDKNLKLVVRTYAKDKSGIYDDLKKRRTDILIPGVKWEKNYATPLIEDSYFYSNLLRYCEIGINIASTVSLELCMFNKPAINIGYNPPGIVVYPYDYTRYYEFDHYKPIAQSGAVDIVKDEKELQSSIKKYLKNPEIDSDKRLKLIKDFFEIEIVSFEEYFKSSNVNIISSLEKIIFAKSN
ncbi:MAG: hypothetical protein IAE65_10325 [Ignavibacteria bacterium]|nr:hypothetical protein [Ignavibacteria bacterium]